MSEPIAEGWVTISQGAEATGYHVKYLRRLARLGRIEGRKVNRGWLVNASSLLAYKRQMDSLGSGRHNPLAQAVGAMVEGAEGSCWVTPDYSGPSGCPITLAGWISPLSC